MYNNRTKFDKLIDTISDKVIYPSGIALAGIDVISRTIKFIPKATYEDMLVFSMLFFPVAAKTLKLSADNIIYKLEHQKQNKKLDVVGLFGSGYYLASGFCYGPGFLSNNNLNLYRPIPPILGSIILSSFVILGIGFSCSYISDTLNIEKMIRK